MNDKTRLFQIANKLGIKYNEVGENNKDIVYDYEFDKYGKLRSLWLPFIEELPSKVFESFDCLNKLCFSDNINTIHEDAFFGLKNLRRLSFINLNSQLHQSHFKPLSNLEFLAIYQGNIQITSDLLFYLSKLKALLLNRLKLSKIPSQFLSYSPHLKVLNLSFNRIEKLVGKDFHHSNIEFLRLRNNDLKYIGNDVFDKLPNLISLELSNNKISQLPQSINQLNLLFFDFANNPGMSVIEAKNLDFNGYITAADYRKSDRSKENEPVSTFVYNNLKLILKFLSEPGV